jgi:hypothetical protein
VCSVPMGEKGVRGGDKGEGNYLAPFHIFVVIFTRPCNTVLFKTRAFSKGRIYQFIPKY